jgi:hypothetical protein
VQKLTHEHEEATARLQAEHERLLAMESERCEDMERELTQLRDGAERRLAEQEQQHM